jgi:hypothetical protein
MQKKIISVFLIFLFSQNVFSWTNHTLGTYASLSEMSEIKNAKSVPVESLESFLEKEKDGLEKLIGEQEDFARLNIPNYPPKPSSLGFIAKNPKELRKNFLNALRLNPNIKLAYFIQDLPSSNISANKKFPAKNLTVFKNLEFTDRLKFYSIKEKELVSPLAILSTAADEPDYGHDIDLYLDSNSEHGKIYEFGTVPFGNTKYEYGSQAPFHMGFYHEAGIAYTLGPFIKRTLPELRLQQNLSLAKFAFKTGHPYWGYRFLGWGLHYIQDLTQPYHSTLLPGIGTANMLGIYFRSTIGFDGAKKAMVERVSDRHTAIEHYQYEILEYLYRKKMNQHPMILSYSEADQDLSYGEYNFEYPRAILSKESNSRAEILDEKIEQWEGILKFTKKETKYEDVTDLEKAKDLDAYLFQMMKSFGAHSRNFIRAGLK